MDEEIELTTVDGQTVRVALSATVIAVGKAIQGDMYGVKTRDGEWIDVRRARADRAQAIFGLIKAIRAITVDLPNDEPNGEAERQIDNLLAAIDGILPWAEQNESMRIRVGRISDAGAKLCTALADDTRALRLAAEAYFGGDFSKPDPTGATS